MEWADEKGEKADIEEIEEKKSDLEELWTPLVTASYGGGGGGGGGGDDDWDDDDEEDGGNGDDDDDPDNWEDDWDIEKDEL